MLFPSPLKRLSVVWVSMTFAVALAVSTLVPATAGAADAPPFNGQPISAGLGPTYGETWCADPAPGSSIANQQGPPLALVPQEAIACTLDQINQEAADAGIPPRMTYSVIGSSDAGRDLYGVVVNALETQEQQRDYDRWLQIRDLMFSDPAGAQDLLASFGDEVKIPVFIEANIHGGEEEGTDAMLQVVRDLVTLPYGTNPEVDAFLDHAILILIPSQNPDGRFIGQRQNANGFDMNRDLLVQSQPEIRANVALQQQWLAPVGLAMHGYVNPTLIDGLTKPHNPGLEYDLFVNWNQRRLDVNEAALAEIGMGITRPVNQWNADADDTPPGNPAIAEGWDDWGPFYTQTYMAFYGVDSSTLEMCSTGPGCNGRLGSKTAQYVGFYSSVGYWIANRTDILHDQLEIFRRGLESAPRPQCCQDPLIASRGFTEDQHNWMVPYPQAFVIPYGGSPGGHTLGFDDGQRSQAESNRMAQWLLDNGIELSRTTKDYVFNGQTIAKHSYVVFMDQPLRGLAYTALAEGQDVSTRITQLYAPPGAWSHGQLWGADTIEVKTTDTFAPNVEPIAAVNPLLGGLRGGGPAAWYAITLQGAAEVRAVLDLLRAGVDGEVAESSFQSASAGPMPAGSLLFQNTSSNAAALASAGASAGVYFERVSNANKPAQTTQLDEAPKVAVLVNSANPAAATGTTPEAFWSLKQIFGADAQYVSVVAGTNSLQNALDDPLANIDVIYNTGQNWPAATNATARSRLTDFFNRGGGYIGTSQSGNNFTFMVGAGLVDAIAQTSATAGGGIAKWTNAGVSGPVTGGLPAEDFLYLPQNVTYFSTTPTGATVDGTYLAGASSGSEGPTALFIAGLWRNRLSTSAAGAPGAPIVLHGASLLNDSRYVGLATNPFSRGDAEREWPLIGQAALWTNLTDG